MDEIRISHDHARESVDLDDGDARIRVGEADWNEWVEPFAVEPRERIGRYLVGLEAAGGRAGSADRDACWAAVWQVAEYEAAAAFLARVREQAADTSVEREARRALDEYERFMRAQLIKQSKVGVDDAGDDARLERAAAIFAAAALARAALDREMTTARTLVDRAVRAPTISNAERLQRIGAATPRYEITRAGAAVRDSARKVARRVARARYRIGANSGDARLEIERMLARFRSGEISRAELRGQLTNTVRRYSTSSYRSGRTLSGVVGPLSKEDQRRLTALRREEQEFIDGFMNDIGRRGYSDQRALWRAEQYARGTCSQAAGNMGWLAGMQERGLRVRWVYDPTAKHCPQCVDRHGREWPAEDVPVVPGRCPRCYSSCKCTLVPVGAEGRGPDATPSSGPPPPLDTEVES